MLVLLDRHQLGDAATLSTNNTAKIVPDEIYNHEVLSLFLRRFEDAMCDFARHRWRFLHRALDRSKLAVTLAIPFEESLRAGADDGGGGQLEVGAVRGRVFTAKFLVQCPGIYALAVDLGYRDQSLVC